AAIIPFLVNEEERANTADGFETKKAIRKAFEGIEVSIQVIPYDFSGCGCCANVCPSKEKALIMKLNDKPAEAKKDNWTNDNDTVVYKEGLMSITTVKGSRLQQPLFEFSGACAGCGETPYAKLVTQLFGDRRIVANATGCSSIWGGSAPST